MLQSVRCLLGIVSKSSGPFSIALADQVSILMRIVETRVPRDGHGPPTNSDEYYFAIRDLFPHARKMMSWADSYVSLCECACCGLKRIPIQPRINKIFSCCLRQQNAMTHIPRNLPHYNLQQGSKCSASFRWGVGFGYRLKSAPFLRDHIRHDQLYAAVARPVTCLRQIRRCNIRVVCCHRTAAS